MGQETLSETMTRLVALHIANNHQMYYEAYDDSEASSYDRAIDLGDYVKDAINCDSWEELRDDILEHALAAVDWEQVLTDVFGDE